MKTILLAFIFAAGSLCAQISSPISSSRTIDWTNSGIPGGIPQRAVISSTIDANTYGNGTMDATAAIQNALNNCPANEVVLLGAGTFEIDGNIQVPSNVTLRGSGPQKTILKGFGSGQAMISFGPGPTFSGKTWIPDSVYSIPVSAGSTRGSNTVTLIHSAGITVGSYLLMTELNDTSFVTVNGSYGKCNWCDGFWGGARSLGQIVEVTSVNGNKIGFSPSLYITYKDSLLPLATPFTMGAKYAGAEDLQIYAADSTGYGTNFSMYGTAYCWIKNCEGNYADGDHVLIQYSYRGVVRDSYFHDAFSHTPGETDADLDLANNTSGFLIENNQFWRLHVSIMLEWGAAGNVIAYNYAFGNFASNATNALFGSIDLHGAHPMFNLIEGNRLSGYCADAGWGSSSDQTLFRNWIDGTNKICNPIFGRGVPDTASSWWACQQNIAIEDQSEQSDDNFVGNVVGSKDQLQVTYYNNGTRVLPMVPMVVATSSASESNRGYDDITFGFSFGFDGTSPSYFNYKFPYETRFVHGNYNFANSSITWDSTNSNHTLPASLYLSSEPAWYGSISWPSIGPDVKGYYNENPAEVCFEKGLMPTCLQSTSTGVPKDKKPAENVKIYPNPAQNQIFISASGASEPVLVSLYTLDGQLTGSQTLLLADPSSHGQQGGTLDVSDLNPGMYFVRVENKNFVSNQKIVISR